jgi:hypothetical protein
MHSHAFILIPIFNPLEANSLEWKAHHTLCHLYKQGLADRVVLLAAVRPHGNERLHELLAQWTPHVLQVRTYTYTVPMFYKEQLLALGVQWIVQHVPRTICFAVVWMDCDVLFLHADWLRRVEHALADWNSLPIVQAYQTAYELEESKLCITSTTKANKKPTSTATRTMGAVAAHGHVHLSSRINPGYVWAARLAFLESLPYFGFHPGFVLGGYDAALVHMLGIELEFDPLVTRMHKHASTTVGQAILNYFRRRTTTSGYGINQSQYCSYVNNVVKVIYHGSLRNRQYKSRYEILRQHDFDPSTDIRHDSFLANDDLAHFTDHVWEQKPDLVTDMTRYFSRRQESLSFLRSTTISWQCHASDYACDTAKSYGGLPSHVSHIRRWPVTTSWTNVLLTVCVVLGALLVVLVLGFGMYSYGTRKHEDEKKRKNRSLSRGTTNAFTTTTTTTTADLNNTGNNVYTDYS